MLSKPKISIILTTWNRKVFLCKAIDSILNQEFKNFELIIIDNNSDFDVEDIVSKYKDDRIVFFKNKINSVVAINRNIGLRNAKGDYIAFCDDDDCWDKKKLKIQLNVMESESIEFSSTAKHIIDENDKVIKFSFIHQKILNCLILMNPLNAMLLNNYISLSSVMIRNNGQFEFDESEYLSAVEDFDLWLKLFSRSITYKYIDQKLIYYRKHSSNTSSKIDKFWLSNAKTNYVISKHIIRLKNIKFYKYYLLRLIIGALKIK